MLGSDSVAGVESSVIDWCAVACQRARLCHTQTHCSGWF